MSEEQTPKPAQKTIPPVLSTDDEILAGPGQGPILWVALMFIPLIVCLYAAFGSKQPAPEVAQPAAVTEQPEQPGIAEEPLMGREGYGRRRRAN